MARTRAQREKWIESLAAHAQAAAKKWGVLASVALAQAALESAWGQSRLTREANNFFGYKARRNQKHVVFPTQEVIHGKRVTVEARFRAFDSAAECFDAYGELLGTLPRYAPVLAAADDFAVYAARLQECGYATDPRYAVKLVGLIRDYDLTRFDAAAARAKTNGGRR
jgi:flagellum-specific peptidoglycan hydrolase FlgJ